MLGAQVKVLALNRCQIGGLAGGVGAVEVGHAAEHGGAACRHDWHELQAVQRQTCIVGDPEGGLNVPDARRGDHEGRGGDAREGEGFRRTDQPLGLKTGRSETSSAGGKIRGTDVLKRNLVDTGHAVVHRSGDCGLGSADALLLTGGEQQGGEQQEQRGSEHHLPPE